MATYYTWTDTPAGTALLVGDDRVLHALYWKVFKRTPALDSTWIEDATVFTDVLQQLAEYFAGKRTNFELEYRSTWGTEFQRNVWKQIEQIPYGEYSSYQKIAAALGNPKAVRAVGTAVGSNPLSIIVPCHRVLTSTGGVTGYAGGLEAKRWLLRREGGIF